VHSDFPNALYYTLCVSESVDFATLFLWFSNTVADAAIAILLRNLKRFSCNGAVDWSTTFLRFTKTVIVL
jgi:hypothetical protein